MDRHDQLLLYELDKKSNLPLAELSKKLKRSKQFILYRMKKLEEQGIITGYNAIVDMSKLGYFTFRVYFKLHTVTTDQSIAFVKFVKDTYPHVWTITTMHEKWDYALFLGVKTIMEFHEIWDGIMLHFKEKIKRYNVAVYAPIYNFNRTFFVPEKKEVIVRTYGGGVAEVVDDLDRQIIELYAANVRLSSLEMGKKLGVSADTVRSRIKRLEKRKIICGYKIGLDVHSLGYVGYRVDIELTSTKRNAALFEFCKQHSYIYQINKSIGGANFEIEVIVKDFQDLLRVINELKTQFHDVIDDVEYFGFSTFHILNYIPD